jgi:hypothetical protein
MSGAYEFSGSSNTVDVLSLEGFQTLLDARLTEAESVRTSLIEVLARTAPQLGGLPDATYVSERYQTLYDQHVAGIDVLLNALRATKEALASITETYQTNEARLTANANEIADALTSASGASNGASYA